ncbi:MAG: hypothetical protein EZS28_034696 [Streblomastix strix]|uniref:Uncharacterized protein n=1 Tax=Streblomastix strix TaxID=222440 RepID=A0A5J4UGH5_9EUKA|nr:MAG: hypothetical protein EZS28_034696 [Streblomastix strix]
MLTTPAHGEVAIYAMNQVWKQELPWIHPPIPLLPAVLRRIRERRKWTIVVAPLWPGQICTGTGNEIDQEGTKTPSRKDMLFPNAPKARNGRRYTIRLMRALNTSNQAMKMILYGQRFNTQRRYYYAMKKHRDWERNNHLTIHDILAMKPRIMITEVLAQFTSTKTSACSVLQLLNGLSSMLSLTFNVDFQSNSMLRFTRKKNHIIHDSKNEI